MEEVDLQPIDKDHFLVHGYTIERVYGRDNDANAPSTRCVVFRESEIYVAFKSNEKGEYLFNLPLGHVYELQFGGEDYVNKRILIDARNCEPKKEGFVVGMDITLFRPVDGIDYDAMNAPIVRWFYDSFENDLMPDLDVVDGMWRTVEKLFKKSEKAATK